MSRLVLCLIAASALTAAAFAQTPGPPAQFGRPLYPPGTPNPLEDKDLAPAAEVASSFGLKGHLAVDCTTDPGTLGHVRFHEQADGSLINESVDPDGSRVLTIMLKGKRLDDQHIEFLGYASYNGPPLKRLVWQTDGTRFRFVSSQALDGTWLIRDSRFGARVWQWVTPCKD